MFQKMQTAGKISALLVLIVLMSSVLTPTTAVFTQDNPDNQVGVNGEEERKDHEGEAGDNTSGHDTDGQQAPDQQNAQEEGTEHEEQQQGLKVEIDISKETGKVKIEIEAQPNMTYTVRFNNTEIGEIATNHEGEGKLEYTFPQGNYIGQFTIERDQEVVYTSQVNQFQVQLRTEEHEEEEEATEVPGKPKVEIEIEEHEIKIEVEGATPNTIYNVTIGEKWIGKFTTDGEGEGELETTPPTDTYTGTLKITNTETGEILYTEEIGQFTVSPEVEEHHETEPSDEDSNGIDDSKEARHLETHKTGNYTKTETSQVITYPNGTSVKMEQTVIVTENGQIIKLEIEQETVYPDGTVEKFEKKITSGEVTTVKIEKTIQHPDGTKEEFEQETVTSSPTTIGALVKLETNGIELTRQDSNITIIKVEKEVTVQPLAVADGLVKVNVTAPTGTPGKVIIIEIERLILNTTDLSKIQVLLDDVDSQPATSAEEVLTANATTAIHYIRETPTGTQVLLYVPYWSAHTVIVQLIGALETLMFKPIAIIGSPLLIATAVIAVLVVAALYLTRNRELRYGKPPLIQFSRFS